MCTGPWNFNWLSIHSPNPNFLVGWPLIDKSIWLTLRLGLWIVVPAVCYRMNLLRADIVLLPLVMHDYTYSAGQKVSCEPMSVSSQILTDCQSSSTSILSEKFAINWSLDILATTADRTVQAVRVWLQDYLFRGTILHCVIVLSVIMNTDFPLTSLSSWNPTTSLLILTGLALAATVHFASRTSSSLVSRYTTSPTSLAALAVRQPQRNAQFHFFLHLDFFCIPSDVPILRLVL